MTRTNLLSMGLIATLIIPFLMLDVTTAEIYDGNPKDKTLERLQEKETRELVLKQLKSLGIEYDDLEQKLESVKSTSEREKVDDRLQEIKAEINKIEQDNHKHDIPSERLEGMIDQQDAFEEQLRNSKILEFVTSVGIDLTSQEIQIGLNRDTVDEKNIDSIVTQIEQIMPNGAKWHVVYSDLASFVSCTR